MSLLEIKNLEVFYGVIQALKGISFNVDEGEIITLIGANGAGKTTTMQSVIGLIPKKGGTVTYNGKDITQGFLAPYISNPDDIVYYDRYDVSGLINEGENIIAVLLGKQVKPLINR